MKQTKGRLRRMVLTLIVVILCSAVAAYAILDQAKFGNSPQGERLSRIEASPHYKNGQFVNTVSTQMLADGENSYKILWKSLWADKSRLRPAEALPTVKVDIKALASTQLSRDTILWLGHSSYYMHMGGKKILVDPVFSNYGAPFSFFNKTFAGTDVYTAADMPELDFLLISHDHWDHLDYQSSVDLLPKVKKIIVPLGVGAHFERFGYPAEKIVEADWNTALPFGELTVHVVPARHYSGRTLSRNKTLWAGFVLETPQHRIFLSGDTGFGPHFADIARLFPAFDVVMLDGGQYDARWPLIHMTPEEAVLAAQSLNAKAMMLGHVGRFSIAGHTWDDPFIRANKASKNGGLLMLTPIIGQAVHLDAAAPYTDQTFTRWWEGLD